MTYAEARTIAMMRMECRFSLGKIGQMAIAVFGRESCDRMSGKRRLIGQPLGERLVIQMERKLGLEDGESSKMIMTVERCTTCGAEQVSICYPEDAAKECATCRNMTAFLQ